MCFSFGTGSNFSLAMRFFGDSPRKRGKAFGTSRYSPNDLKTGFVAPVGNVRAPLGLSPCPCAVRGACRAGGNPGPGLAALVLLAMLWTCHESPSLHCNCAGATARRRAK